MTLILLALVTTTGVPLFAPSIARADALPNPTLTWTLYDTYSTLGPNYGGPGTGVRLWYGNVPVDTGGYFYFTIRIVQKFQIYNKSNASDELTGVMYGGQYDSFSAKLYCNDHFGVGYQNCYYKVEYYPVHAGYASSVLRLTSTIIDPHGYRTYTRYDTPPIYLTGYATPVVEQSRAPWQLCTRCNNINVDMNGVFNTQVATHLRSYSDSQATLSWLDKPVNPTSTPFHLSLSDLRTVVHGAQIALPIADVGYHAWALFKDGGWVGILRGIIDDPLPWLGDAAAFLGILAG